MKRFLYFLFAFLLLFGAFTIYQYVQYQEHLEALKDADSETPPELPVDIVAVEDPPATSYYAHHEQLSTIMRYNPLLRATIQRKLCFYDFTKHNFALLDFYNLLNYRERLMITAAPTDNEKIEEQIKVYSAQLCTRWKAFAEHMKQTYPNMPAAAGLNNLCGASLIQNYKQTDISSWMLDPIKK